MSFLAVVAITLIIFIWAIVSFSRSPNLKAMEVFGASLFVAWLAFCIATAVWLIIQALSAIASLT